MKNFTNRTLQMIFLSFVAIIVFSSCSSDNSTTPDNWNSLKIAVFSDPHLYDLSLGTTGEAFETYLMSDAKMLRESNAIMESMVSSIISENPDIVIVPGDLTKDGELKSHQLMVTYLKKFTDKGIKVLVIPGNHDILNPEAASFNGATKTKVANVSVAEFQNLYNNFGFANAISKDANSLSYISEPKTGLWVFCIDDCRYNENVDKETIGGKLSDASMTWIKSKLAEAKAQNKQVIGVMHHGVVEHFMGQSTFFADFLINDFKNVATQLSDAGMKVLLSGHFHAQDVTANSATSPLFDIETGSMIQYPCPYRILTLTNDSKLSISTKKLTSINYNLGGAADFLTYSKNFIDTYLVYTAIGMLMQIFQFTQQEAVALSPDVLKAMEAHYFGDETPDAATLQFVQQLTQNADPRKQGLGQALYSLWTELSPKDNNLTIDIKTGTVTR